MDQSRILGNYPPTPPLSQHLWDIIVNVELVGGGGYVGSFPET